MRDMSVIRRSSSGKDQVIDGKAAAYASDCQTAELLFANFAMPVMAAKAAKAMLHSSTNCIVRCDGYGHNEKVDEGYRVIVNRLPKFATCQVIAIAKKPELLLGDKAEAVWGYITSPAITTPVLPEWRDYIIGELTAHAKIGVPNGFGYPVWLAAFTTEDIDRIVCEGLKKKRIRI